MAFARLSRSDLRMSGWDVNKQLLSWLGMNILECLHAFQLTDMNVLCRIGYLTFYLCQNVTFYWATSSCQLLTWLLTFHWLKNNQGGNYDVCIRSSMFWKWALVDLQDDLEVVLSPILKISLPELGTILNNPIDGLTKVHVQKKVNGQIWSNSFTLKIFGKMCKIWNSLDGIRFVVFCPEKRGKIHFP